MPLLDLGAEITLSGHSLGGAVATIVGMRLQARGYCVIQVMTFGAPKVMDRLGAQGQAFRDRVLRITNLLDPVPLLPFGFCTPFSGPFAQLGAQILLIPRRSCGSVESQPAFCYLEPRAADKPWVASFLLHAMAPTAHSCFYHHRMKGYRMLLEPFVVAPHTVRQ